MQDAPRRTRSRRRRGAGRSGNSPSTRNGAPREAAPAPKPAAPAAAPSPAFSALGLSDMISSAVASAGYSEPSPIQHKAIPHVLEGRDLIGCAQTGTGKTAAFALPILQELFAEEASEPTDRARKPVIRAVVLAPTRELASQIGDSFDKYARGHRFQQVTIFGGVGKNPQVTALRRGVDVLVATPGRLLDLMGDGEVNFEHVTTLVLDEADRMLDMGFIHDVRKIIAKIPEKRQTLLFSATMPKEIEALARKTMMDPVRVAVDPVSSTCEPIEQSVYFVEKRRKVDLLTRILGDSSIERALVFTRTKHEANRVAEKLGKANITAAPLHGNKSQSARERALAGFKSGEIRVVVATDLASRGIDVKDLSHVINFHLPADAESYVHRVGRTGRAGKSGIAIAFCAPEERPLLMGIERLTRRQLLRRETPEGLVTAGEDEFARPPRPPRRRPAGGGGGNGSRRAADKEAGMAKPGGPSRTRRARRRRSGGPASSPSGNG